MTRSHPPTLLRLAERTLSEECRIERGQKILVAASGGGDSSALLHVLARLAPRFGIELVAHGVDHGLRPEASLELAGAARLAAALGVPFQTTRVDVGAGGNLQARARDARRTALVRAMEHAGATRIATAHHANDRAETVLLRLLHGARPEGLRVLAAADGPWIRPLIRARKEAVLAHLARHRIEFAEDPSNCDRRFLRVRVRMEVLPLLAELSPAIVEHLTALADELARDPLPGVVDETGRPIALRRAHLREIHRALSLRQKVQVRLSKGRELFVDPESRSFRVERRFSDTGALQSESKRKRGGAKIGKSG